LACLQSGLRNMIYLSIQRTQYLLHIVSVVITNLLHNFKNVLWDELW